MSDVLALGHGTDNKRESHMLYGRVDGKWKWWKYGKNGCVEAESEAIFKDFETCKRHAKSHLCIIPRIWVIQPQCLIC